MPASSESPTMRIRQFSVEIPVTDVPGAIAGSTVG
jgi:hypothetical protein